MDADGGIPLRITHHPGADELVDWHPDGKSLLYRSSMMSARPRFNQFYRIDSHGGMPERLPLAYGETAGFSPDGKILVFTYLKDFQDEAWKRYTGGRAPNLWMFDLATGQAEVLAPHVAPDSTPMPTTEAIYFLSERGPERRSNIWRLDRKTESLHQITNFADMDVRHPSIGDNRIVFQANGRLYSLALSSHDYKPLSITISMAEERRTLLVESGKNYIEALDPASGDMLAIEARGDLFLYDIKHHIVQNITRTPAVAEHYPALSPDQKYIAFHSDESGEYQLVVQNLDTGKQQRLTSYERGYRYQPVWSPNGKWLAFIDWQQRIWVLNVAKGNSFLAGEAKGLLHSDLQQFHISWSPDSRFMAFSVNGENRNRRIHLYDVEKRKTHQLTSGYFSDDAPVFDPSGNYIITRSYRHFSPVHGDIDATWTYANSIVLMIFPLRHDLAAPIGGGWAKVERQDKVKVDVEGFETRGVMLPIAPGNIVAHTVSDQGIMYLRLPNEGGAERVSKVEFYKFDGGLNHIFKEAESLRDVRAANGRLVVQQGDNYILFRPDGEVKSSDLQMDKLQVPVDRSAMYQQSFMDAWRFLRDFFYDPGMHGLDWEAVRSRYEPWVKHVYTDTDFGALLAEVSGELSAGHVYVSGGSRRRQVPSGDTGLLGIDFMLKDDAYAIKKIYRSGPRTFQQASPLDRVGLNVREGNYILAVNDIPLDPQHDPWAPFEGLADQDVVLTIADDPQGKNSRKIIVKTLSDEAKLRELYWVEENRQYVEARSNGRLGYIYVPNTGDEGQTELMLQYRAQFSRPGLIIDERFNAGGALGDRFVELLGRRPLNYFVGRQGHYSLPELANNGAMAMLTNGWSVSGGDGFPFLFKTEKLGPLIGTRTWGALIGPTVIMPLLNGGMITVPPQRVSTVEGEWAEGNEGVEPDIFLVNNPASLFRGKDQQLDLAIEEVLEKVEAARPVRTPSFPSEQTGE